LGAVQPVYDMKQWPKRSEVPTYALTVRRSV